MRGIRSIRQDDPLSLYFFILFLEGFFALIYASEESGTIRGFDQGWGLLFPISFLRITRFYL